MFFHPGRSAKIAVIGMAAIRCDRHFSPGVSISRPQLECEGIELIRGGPWTLRAAGEILANPARKANAKRRGSMLVHRPAVRLHGSVPEAHRVVGAGRNEPLSIMREGHTDD